jgi:hypothetical protein
VISIWDLKAMKCILSFDATEPIVDIQFENNGELLMVLFVYSGIAMFRSSDGTCLAKGGKYI